MKDITMRMFVVTASVAIVTLSLPAFAGDLPIQLGNNSWDELKAVAWSPAGADTWTEVTLPEGKLGAGSFVEMIVADGDSQCIYDLRFTKMDDSTHDRAAVDLCAATYYHFADQ